MRRVDQHLGHFDRVPDLRQLADMLVVGNADDQCVRIFERVHGGFSDAGRTSWKGRLMLASLTRQEQRSARAGRALSLPKKNGHTVVYEREFSNWLVVRLARSRDKAGF